MTQGIFIEGRRPKSKKQVKEAIQQGLSMDLEATSAFGNEYGGRIEDAPEGVYTFVGPDPYTDRRFYGTIKVRNGQIKVT